MDFSRQKNRERAQKREERELSRTEKKTLNVEHARAHTSIYRAKNRTKDDAHAVVKTGTAISLSHGRSAVVIAFIMARRPVSVR